MNYIHPILQRKALQVKWWDHPYRIYSNDQWDEYDYCRYSKNEIEALGFKPEEEKEDWIDKALEEMYNFWPEVDDMNDEQVKKKAKEIILKHLPQ